MGGTIRVSLAYHLSYLCHAASLEGNVTCVDSGIIFHGDTPWANR